jgi:hypothetical protein
MSANFTSVLQSLISQTIPAQKYAVNVGPTLNGYGAMDT